MFLFCVQNGDSCKLSLVQHENNPCFVDLVDHVSIFFFFPSEFDMYQAVAVLT